MQLNKPLLTIAIPTYNRSGLLEALLEEISRQLEGEDRVELLISNNASTDDTKHVVERACARGLATTCLHNETNIGADANFLQCFQMATGKYLWIFSDDDFFAPGAIAKVLNILDGEDYNLLYVNSYIFDGDAHHSRQSNGASGSLQVFESPESFAAAVHVFFTFISGNIVNRDAVIAARVGDFSELVGSHLIQLGWTYTALGSQGRSGYIREKLIGNRADNTGGYALCQIFGVNLVRITRGWLSNAKCGDIILNGTLARFLPSHLSMPKIKDGKSSFFKEDPHKVLSPVFEKNLRYWFFVYPIMAMPVGVGRAWLMLGRIINKIDKTLGSPLLRWP